MFENPQRIDNWNIHWQELSNDIYFNTPAVKYRWSCIESLMNLGNCDSSDVKLIDIGCGTGHLLTYFFNKYPSILIKGTDNSDVGLEVAKKLLPQGDFFQANLLEIPTPTSVEHFGWASHACCSEVLEHLDEPITFLKNAGQFLQKGASITISVPGGPMSSFDIQVGHRKHYTHKILKQELQAAGYEVNKIVCAGFPFHNLYRIAFILRGESVLEDAKQQLKHNPFINTVMKIFNFLFKFNMFNSGFGWTLVAKATWKG